MCSLSHRRRRSQTAGQAHSRGWRAECGEDAASSGLGAGRKNAESDSKTDGHKAVELSTSPSKICKEVRVER